MDYFLILSSHASVIINPFEIDIISSMIIWGIYDIKHWNIGEDEGERDICEIWMKNDADRASSKNLISSNSSWL